MAPPRLVHQLTDQAGEFLDARGDATLLVGLLASGAWLLGARGLRGAGLRRWLAVPALLLAGLLCVLGPGRFFPKEPWEGPAVLHISPQRAVVALDLPGLALAGAAAALGARLLWRRVRQRPA